MTHQSEILHSLIFVKILMYLMIYNFFMKLKYTKYFRLITLKLFDGRQILLFLNFKLHHIHRISFS